MPTDEDGTPTGGPPARHLVVGVDGSAGARAALVWALLAAAARGCGLRVVSVHPLVGAGDEVATEFRRRARELVGDVLQMPGLAAAAQVGVDVDALAGDTAERLVRASEHAELLVIGSRGRSAMAGGLLESVALQCIAGAGCPVVVVPGTPVTLAYDRVVVGFDGSQEAGAALEEGIREAVLREWGEVEVVSTFWLGGAWADVDALGDDARLDIAREIADRVSAAVGQAVARIRATGARVPEVRTVVLAGRPDDALLMMSKNARLLVVGSQRRGSVSDMLLGSVATGCTVRAHRPTMVLPTGVAVSRAGLAGR